MFVGFGSIQEAEYPVQQDPYKYPYEPEIQPQPFNSAIPKSFETLAPTEWPSPVSSIPANTTPSPATLSQAEYLERFNTAVRLAQAGKKVEAHSKLKELEIIRPNDSNLLLWLTFTTQDIKAARQWLQKLRQLDPQNPSLVGAYRWLAEEEYKNPTRQALSFEPLAESDSAYAQPALATGMATYPAQPVLKGKERPEKRGNGLIYLLLLGVIGGLGAVAAIYLLVIQAKPAPATEAISITPLPFQVVDAAYSERLNRIIMLSANPNLLHIYNPDNGSDETVILPKTPLSLSVSPDGQTAAVGYSGLVSHVSLYHPALLKTIVVSVDAGNVVLAGNGWVYIAPSRDQWMRMHAVNLSNNQEVESTGQNIFAGSVYRLHPNGQSLYGATRGLSPSKMEKINIAGVLPAFSYQYPYHGTYEVCGNLWMEDEGRRIFTACGNVFRTSADQKQDMIYTGQLDGVATVTALANIRGGGKILLIGTSNAGKSDPRAINPGVIGVYDYQTLSFVRTVALPNLKVNNRSYPSTGKFLFIFPAGYRYYAIIQAEDKASGLNVFGLATGSVSDTFTK
jgi:hypothetical protein